MRTPKQPFDGDPSSSDGAPSYEWLDEWLCEYVDGTMDPSMKAVFKQYVEADPELKAHVERLRKTREILCGCDAPESDCPDLPTEVESERNDASIQAPPVLAISPGKRSGRTMGIAASIAVALVVGFLAGSVLVDPATLSPPTAEAVETDGPVQKTVRNEAPPRPGRSAAAVQSQVSSVSGDDVVLPGIPMSSATGTDSMDVPSSFTPFEDR